MNFQVTVLKILVSYPDDFAVMESPQAEYGHPGDHRPRLRGLHQAPRCAGAGLEIFSQRLVERISGGWKITAQGRAVLELMEIPPAVSETIQALEETIIISLASVPALRKPADRAKQRRERRLRLRKPACGCIGEPLPPSADRLISASAISIPRSRSREEDRATGLEKAARLPRCAFCG